ncbi:pentapeptide repeat-containing protein [Coprobacter secundus]|uniref:pentapeptide repeat-containing protein n=1 Tax=Coprobacter secundus TaxID=1501392 RepID=UPI0023F6EAE1|nr:pentapeptide repeat-containing protein [Coprobacter secundus]
MKIKIDIKSVFGNVLFSFEKENNTIKDTLVEANLKDADLEYANLKGAYLKGASLEYANLGNANLKGASLKGANLRDANLRNASLEYANLKGANLRGANLRGASLEGASLEGANLRGANLRGASLEGASLEGADLEGADYSEYTSFLAYQCPIEGSFIGWKKCGRYIVKLKICEDADRSSSTSLKCRCSKAEVLEIQNLDGSRAGITEICSDYNKDFIYKVGETVEVKDFNKCRWNECSNGIHFFIDRNVAVAYIK